MENAKLKVENEGKINYLQEMGEGSDYPAASPEHVCQDIRDICWLTTKLRNEKQKATLLRILQKEVSLLLRILLFLPENEEVYQQLQHAEADLDHLEEMVNRIKGAADRLLIEEIAHSRRGGKPHHGYIQPPAQIENQSGSFSVPGDRYRVSASVLLSPCHASWQGDSTRQEYALNSGMPCDKMTYSKNVVTPSATSITINGDTVAPQNDKINRED